VVALQGLALEITGCKVTFTNLQLDKVTARIEVNLKGDGADFVVAKIGGEKYRVDVENGKATSGSIDIDRMPGQDSLTIELTAFSRYGELLAQRSFRVKIPTVSIGETLPDVGNDMSLTLLWWKESKIALCRWSKSEVYTINSKPGFKFVLLAYEFQNNGRRLGETPYIDKGEIATTQGYIYPSLDLGHRDYLEEHSPREPRSQELSEFIGDSGGYEKLLPRETVKGRIIFEIPKDGKPL